MRQLAFVVFWVPSVAWADWSQWRGPHRDGVTPNPPLSWPTELKKLWVVEVGEGHSSPVISRNRVFTLTRVGNEEVVRAIDLTNGTEIWNQKYPAFAELDSAVGWHGLSPKSTPCVSEGRVYTFGISGILSCWDVIDGKLIWRQTFERRFAKTWPLYGVATSPLVYEGKVIVWAGGHNQGALLAFDKASGKELWVLAADGPGYSSPVVAELAGTRQLVVQSQQFLIAVDPNSGKELWKQRFTTGYDQNSITPVVVNDWVIHSGYQKPLKAIRVARAGGRFQLTDQWELRNHPLYLSSPVVAGKRLFGLSMADGGSIVVVELQSGRVQWKKSEMGEYAAFVVAGPNVLVQTTDGTLYVLNADSSRWDPIRQYRICDDAVWSHPALAGDILIVKDKQRLYAWRVR